MTRRHRIGKRTNTIVEREGAVLDDLHKQVKDIALKFLSGSEESVRQILAEADTYKDFVELAHKYIGNKFIDELEAAQSNA